MERSLGQWAPWIDDPDPPADSLMTLEVSKKAAESAAKLMAERQEQNILYTLLRNNPRLTREEAQAIVDQFL